MEGVVFERLREEDMERFKKFCLDHWPGPHPLIHRQEMFEYYYRDTDGQINFVIARDEASRDIQGVCGFIKASATVHPDIWISYILTKKDVPFGIGFRLLETVKDLTGCRTIACNNIRKETKGLYDFFGWCVGDMTQYFRHNEELERYTLCTVGTKAIPYEDSQADFIVKQWTSPAQLELANATSLFQAQPYKDNAYIEKRYFRNPWIDYEVYGGYTKQNDPCALLVLRAFQHKNTMALRVVDYVGAESEMWRWGAFLDGKIKQTGADFCDWFVWKREDDVMKKAGFVPREDGDGNVIPFYLSPPVFKNVTVTCFTSGGSPYQMFRADGDQDRPNLE